MAYCGEFSLELAELPCIADIGAWSAALVQTMQAGLDHVIACINNVVLPAMDICVLKDDLIECPLTCEMMDFTDIAYGDDGGVGVLPYPPGLGDLEFRYGVKTTGTRIGSSLPTVGDVVTFDTPFSNSCLYVGVTVERAFNCDPGSSGGMDLIRMHDHMLRIQSPTGFTVYFANDEFETDCYLTYRYFAVGN